MSVIRILRSIRICSHLTRRGIHLRLQAGIYGFKIIFMRSRGKSGAFCVCQFSFFLNRFEVVFKKEEAGTINVGNIILNDVKSNGIFFKDKSIKFVYNRYNDVNIIGTLAIKFKHEYIFYYFSFIFIYFIYFSSYRYDSPSTTYY